MLTFALKNFALPDRPLGGDSLMNAPLRAHGIAEFRWLVNYSEHRDVSLAADLQAADAVLPADHARGVDRAAGDDLFQVQT